MIHAIIFSKLKSLGPRLFLASPHWNQNLNPTMSDPITPTTTNTHVQLSRENRRELQNGNHTGCGCQKESNSSMTAYTRYRTTDLFITNEMLYH